jgi:hypothetical protein
MGEDPVTDPFHDQNPGAAEVTVQILKFAVRKLTEGSVTFSIQKPRINVNPAVRSNSLTRSS